MATKEEVARYIRRNYQSQEMDHGALALVFKFDDGRSHQVFVDWNNDDATWTMFFGFVSEWSLEAAGRAVEANDQIFGIQKFMNWVTVFQPQLTETADEEEIDRALSGVAKAADILEEKLTGRDDF